MSNLGLLSNQVLPAWKTPGQSLDLSELHLYKVFGNNYFTVWQVGEGNVCKARGLTFEHLVMLSQGKYY